MALGNPTAGETGSETKRPSVKTTFTFSLTEPAVSSEEGGAREHPDQSLGELDVITERRSQGRELGEEIAPLPYKASSHDPLFLFTIFSSSRLLQP